MEIYRNFSNDERVVLCNATVFGCEEGIDILGQKVVTVRKSHECFNCFGPIEPGDIVISGVAKVEGEIFRSYICHDCCEEVIFDHEHPENCEHFMNRYRLFVEKTSNGKV